MKKKPNLIPLIIILIVFGLFGLLYYSGLRVNITDSMPRGIYFLHSSKSICRGDLVAVKLSVKQLLFGLERGYIKNENTLLFKRVIAIPGDTVTLTDDKIIVGGNEYVTLTYRKDEHNREMYPIKRGVYKNTSGYWVLGENDRSWDSRYFGPVGRDQIISTVKLLWIFK